MNARLWPPPPDVRTSVCDTCSGNIFWQDCPTGGWWIHQQHPEDGHDALPNLDVPLETLTSAMSTLVPEPEYGKAVLVLEVDPERLPDALQSIQRFLLGADDGKLFGPTMHVAVEDVAEAVLKHFERAPTIDESDYESDYESDS